MKQQNQKTFSLNAEIKKKKDFRGSNQNVSKHWLFMGGMTFFPLPPNIFSRHSPFIIRKKTNHTKEMIIPAANAVWRLGREGWRMWARKP